MDYRWVHLLDAIHVHPADRSNRPTGEGVEKWIDVNDPSTQRLLTRVPETPHAEMVRIVDRAEEAFLEWRDASVLRRQGVMLK